MRKTLLALLVAGAFAAPNSMAENPQETAIERRAAEILQADPQTIIRLRQRIQETSAARQAPIVSDFEPDIPQDVLDIEEMFDVTLEPDQPAPKIFIARYQSSAVSFVDAYGNPWPIRKISNFLEGLVLIDKAVPETAPTKGKSGEQAGGIALDDPQAGSFTMTALKHGAVGNITVYLHGLSTPISILLAGKSSMYHRSTTIRVADAGPQTNTNQMFQANGVTIGTSSDPDLNAALYGVSPSGSEQMVVQGAEGKAWIKGDHLFLQSPVSVFSPEIIRASHGNGRFRAYKLPKTTTVMGTNTDGVTVTMKIMRSPAMEIYDSSSRVGGAQ